MINNEVVKLTYLDDTIAVVALEDRVAKNTFTHSFNEQLINTFRIIKDNPMLKVVIVHGYDNFFMCGGSQDELLNLSSGKGTFADLNFYRLFLDCDLPIIAAMQGHSIGGGLIMGCYADMIIMAEEAFYSANFMKYGFTPGFGATYILAQKFGKVIADSMLLGAQNYQGSQLKQWGVSAKIIRKMDVIPTAIEMAKTLSTKSRAALLLLKSHLTSKYKHELPAYIEKELQMHQLTFGSDEVKNRIETLFGK